MSDPNGTPDQQVLHKTKLVLAIRGYQIETKQSNDRRIDYTVSPPHSDDQILIRAITTPKSRSGYIGVDTVKKMSETLDRRHFDKGILIGPRFTQAARDEMVRQNIEAISQARSSFQGEGLYLAIYNHVDALCKRKCGHIPTTDAECTGYTGGKYSCNVRVTSDNASFHFKHGLNTNLEYDLARLLAITQNLNENPS